MPSDIDACVNRMQGQPGVDNPHALCNWMKSNGVGFFGTEQVTDERVAEAIEAFNAEKKSRKVKMDQSGRLPDTEDLLGVEVFAEGTWNGDKYGPKELDAMVEAHSEIGKQIKPFLKLGHDDGQKLIQKDGYPAAGWLDNLRHISGKLVADIKAVPQKIAELIRKKAYGRLSSEIFFNARFNGKSYPRVLRAVALLGGETPAVTTLRDWIDLYNVEDIPVAYAHGTEKEDVRVYERSLEGEEETQEMDEKEVVKLRAEAEASQKRYADEKAALEKESAAKDAQLAKEREAKEAAEKSASEALAQVKAMQEEAAAKEATLKKEALEQKVSAALDKACEEGKVLPKQIATFKALALHDMTHPTDEGVREYSYKNGDKDEKLSWKSADELVFGLIESMEKVVTFTEDSKDEKKPETETDPSAELAKKANEYMTAAKAEGREVSFAQAISAVAPRRDS